MKNIDGLIKLITLSLAYTVSFTTITDTPACARHSAAHRASSHHATSHKQAKAHAKTCKSAKSANQAKEKKPVAIQKQGYSQTKGGGKQFAQGANKNQFANQYSRRSEVLGRDNRLLKTIDGDKHGLGRNFDRLQNDARSIRLQEQADARRNGGHLTKGEQSQLNREENALGKETAMDNRGNRFDRKHPRRAEVLSRAADANFNINQDKGHLKGNYKKLEGEDRSIIRQEQRDASLNGGYITHNEQGQLNREENNLDQQIKKDDSR